MKPSPSIDKAYVTLQNASGIKVGNKVKLLRKAASNEMGWDNTWAPCMDENIGKIGKVTKLLGREGIEIDFGTPGPNYEYPFFVLEKIIVTEKVIQKSVLERPGEVFTIKITKNEALITNNVGAPIITITKPTLDEIVRHQAELD